MSTPDPESPSGDGQALPDIPPPTTEEAAASDINYDEVFYPARPRAARPKARRNQQFGEARPPFEPVGTNPAYVHWLRTRLGSRFADFVVLGLDFRVIPGFLFSTWGTRDGGSKLAGCTSGG
ncbi:MAG: hypothetical protein QJR09_04475 [Micrococcus sp.]|nr:hypothetical protein [Micrococcus sp.]